MSNLFLALFQKRKKKTDSSGNGMTKAISIIAAILLWMFVMGEINPEIDKEITKIKIDIENAQTIEQEGLFLLGTDTETIDITIKGRRNEILGLTAAEIDAAINISGYAKGTIRVPISVSVPNGVTIQQIVPLFVEVQLDALVQRQKPIDVYYIGSAEEEYVHGEPNLEVSQVLVSGPETLVDSIDRVCVEVNLNNTNVDLALKLPLIAMNTSDEEVLNVTIEKQYIDVEVPVYKAKNVPVNVELDISVAEGYKLVSIVQIPVKVDIIGDDGAIENISEINAKPISAHNLTGVTEIPLEFIVPENVEIYGQRSKPRVKIFVEELKEKVMIYSYEEINIIGLDADSEVGFIDTETVEVKVKGATSLIDKIEKEDISLSIDLTNMQKGSFSNFSLDVNVETAYEDIEIDSGKVSIEIK